MNCQELRDKLDSMVLSPDELQQSGMLEHAQHCERCRQELHACQEAWLLLPAALPNDPIDEQLEARVMKAISSHRSTKPSYSHSTVVLKYALAIGVLFLLVGVTIGRLGVVGNGRAQVTDSELERIREIAAQTEKLDALESVFASPQLKYVSLTSTQPRQPTVYLVHDPMSRELHLFGTNLGRHRTDGVTLRVWLLDENRQVASSADIALAEKQTLGAARLILERAELVKSIIITAEDKPEARTPSDHVIFQSDVTDLGG